MNCVPCKHHEFIKMLVVDEALTKARLKENVEMVQWFTKMSNSDTALKELQRIVPEKDFESIRRTAINEMFMSASYRGNIDAMKWLIFNMNTDTAFNNDECIRMAIECDHIEVFEFLLQFYDSRILFTSNNHEMFRLACTNNSLRIALRMVAIVPCYEVDHDEIDIDSYKIKN